MAIAAALLVVLVGGYFAYDAFMSNSTTEQVAVVIPEKKPTVPANILPPTSQPPVVIPVQPPKPPAQPVVPVAVTPPPVAVVKPVVPAQPVRVAAAPSIEFLTWVDNVKISGLVNGSTPRAIINGLLVRPGDTIDSARGIVFDHLDSERQQIVFRDRSGAQTSKSY